MSPALSGQIEAATTVRRPKDVEGAACLFIIYGDLCKRHGLADDGDDRWPKAVRPGFREAVGGGMQAFDLGGAAEWNCNVHGGPSLEPPDYLPRVTG